MDKIQMNLDFLQPKDAWDELSLTDKAKMMEVAVRNGITNLQEIRKKYNEFAEGGNIYKGGGYVSSDSIRSRIANYEGKAMTGAIDPLSGKWDKNRSFEAEDASFYAALPESIREKVLANPDLADNLYSYSYNVGAGNFKKRVVPTLEKYFQGKATVGDIERSMWASGDAKLRGLKIRRAEERAGVRAALDPTKPIVEQPVSTAIYNPYVLEQQNTVQLPQYVPSETEYIRTIELSPERQRAIQLQERFDQINRFNQLMKLAGLENTAIPAFMPETGVTMLDDIWNTGEYAKGGKIYIKPSHRGRLTELKKRTGKTEAELYRTGSPATRKMITFARSARKWKHANGGHLYDGESEESQQMNIAAPDATYVAKQPTFFSIPKKEYDWEEAAINRANQVYSNYNEAKDDPLSLPNTLFHNGLRWIKDNVYEEFPSGVSNCTLSATQWIDPNRPIKGAASIHKNPEKYNYTNIDSLDIVPGNLVISKAPDKESYHTMMVTGFAGQDSIANFRGKSYPVKKGEPLMTYSRGGHDNSFIQRNIPLSVYTANSDGHTENLFYRYNYPREIFLPEIIVTPEKKKK